MQRTLNRFHNQVFRLGRLCQKQFSVSSTCSQTTETKQEHKHEDKETHFGFTTVKESEKADKGKKRSNMCRR